MNLPSMLLICCCLTMNFAMAKERNCAHHAPGEDIYRHYTGSIGTHKVMLDLRYGFCGSSNYGDSYIYDLTKGTVTLLTIFEPATVAHNAELHAAESNLWDADDFEKDNKAHWSFVIQQGRITGKWLSADENNTYDIELVEDSIHALPFDVMTFADSMRTMQPGKQMVACYYDYIGVIPRGSINDATATFINKQLLQFTQTADMGATGQDNMPSALAQKSYISFKTAYEQSPAGNKIFDKAYYASLLFPAYNSDDILCLEYIYYGMPGSDHFVTQKYLNIDVKSRQVLSVDNIFGNNTAKLTTLLQEEYKKNAVKELEKDKITATDDMIITANGIVFCYFYNVNDWPHRMSVCIPYDRLSALLTKNFKQRMHVK